MAKRIAIYVDDSQVPVGVRHFIYRHMDPGIIPGPDETPIMEFDEDNYPLSVCTMIDEVLEQDTENPQCFHASRVICSTHQHPNDPPDLYKVTVKINGQPIPDSAFSYDPATGRIWITDRTIPFYYAGTVTATYKYHAFVVRDSELAPAELLHRGPAATGLLPPVDGQLSWNGSNVEVTWQANPDSITYFYISRYTDASGRVSEWSEEVNTTLTLDPADLLWRVTRNNGGVMEEVGVVSDLRFTDDLLATPTPHLGEPVFTIQSSQNVLVEILNPFVHLRPERETCGYEIRAKDDLDAESEPLVIPPGRLVVPYSRILLRRKSDTGAHCSVDGVDAVTLFDYGPDQTDDILTYDDTMLVDPGVYCYTVFLWDESGEMAAPRSWIVDTVNGTIKELGVI